VTLGGTGAAAPSSGATGPRGPAGPPGKVEVVTCHTVTKIVTHRHRKVHVHRQSCTTRTITGNAKFTATKTSERATLTRRGRVYARGGASASGALVLRDLRPLAPGTYTLTIEVRRGGRVVTTRARVTIG
jgi:hypothetical protein